MGSRRAAVAVSLCATLALTSCALVTPSWFKKQEKTSFALMTKLSTGRLPDGFTTEDLADDCGYGVDCKDPNYSFRAYRDGRFDHVAVCQAFITYAEDHGASAWRRSPENRLHALNERDAMRSLPECVGLMTAASTTEASSNFEMYGSDRKTGAPLQFALWAAQLGGRHSYGMNIATTYVKPGTPDPLANTDPFPEWVALHTLVNNLAAARATSTSLLKVDQALAVMPGMYQGIARLITGEDGMVHAVSLTGEGRLKDLCVSLEPWDATLLGVPDPGTPYDTFILRDRLVPSFGFAQWGACSTS